MRMICGGHMHYVVLQPPTNSFVTEPSSKRSKMTSPQHQFEDMITDEDEEYQSDTFSLPGWFLFKKWA
jgi:hypothetical protein